MKNNYLYICLLLVNTSGKTLSTNVNIVKPSSYTRSYLMNLKERYILKKKI